jgi:hypothetical protein
MQSRPLVLDLRVMQSIKLATAYACPFGQTHALHVSTTEQDTEVVLPL